MSAPSKKKKNDKTWQDFVAEGKVILFGKDISKAKRNQLKINENDIVNPVLLNSLNAPKYFKDVWEYVRVKNSKIFHAFKPDLFYSREKEALSSKSMFVYYHTNPTIGDSGPGSTTSALLTFLANQKMIPVRTTRATDLPLSDSTVRFYFEQFTFEMTKNSFYVDWNQLKALFAAKDLNGRKTFLAHLLADWMSFLVYSRVVSLGNPCTTIETCQFRINSGLPTVLYRLDILADAINARKSTRFPKITFDFLEGCFTNSLVTLALLGMIKIMPDGLISSFGCLKDWNTKNKRNKLTEMLIKNISEFLENNQRVLF